MFAFFKKSPIKKLEKDYSLKLAQARDAQRAGNIQSYATLSEQAAKIYGEIKKHHQK